jgi:hypothetical protein
MKVIPSNNIYHNIISPVDISLSHNKKGEQLNLEVLNEREHFGDLGIDVQIILK